MPSYDSALDFTRKLLKNFNIRTYAADVPSLTGQDLDGGLRRQLEESYDYSTDFCRFLSQCEGQAVYFSQDQFFCRYTLMQLPGQDPPVHFLAGPYLFQRPDRHFLLKIQQKLSVPAGHMDYLQCYYQSLPFIEFEDYLSSALLLLASEVYGEGNFSIHYCRGLLDSSQLMRYSQNTKPDNRQLLEKRYQDENELMQFIASGNYQKTEMILSKFALHSFEQRLPNQLRDQKNYLIITNTLMRKAAEMGGVHPQYLDDLSSQFAGRIERIAGDNDFTALMREMGRKYCLLVRSYSTKGYSPIVKNVMDYIPLHLAEDLSLRALSAHFSVSPTYLSSLFRKESGSTLTEYVNGKRMEQALFLLNSTTLYIQTIAAACGIPDLNYFTKVFKKHTGRTPREYRELIHRNGADTP